MLSIYIYIYTYCWCMHSLGMLLTYNIIYISAGPSREGPPGCEASELNCILYPTCPLILYPCIYSSIPVSCMLYPVSCLLNGASCMKEYWPTDRPLTTTWPSSLSLGPSRVPFENHRLSDLLSRPSKIRKSEPKVPRKLLKRHPKVNRKS